MKRMDHLRKNDILFLMKLSEGNTIKEVAIETGLTYAKVIHLKRRCMAFLKSKSPTQAVAKAIRMGIIK